MRLTPFVLLAVLVIASTAAAQAPAGPPPPVSPARSVPVRVTPKVAAPCAAHAGMLPTAIADLDGDGVMERVSFVREGTQLVVRLLAAPGLRVKRTWRLAGDHLEVAVTRHARARTGDLWLHVTRLDRATNTWGQALWQLVDHDLRVVFKGPGTQRPNVRLDLDGDGRPDPILTTTGGVHALLRGQVVPLPTVRYAEGLHGERAGHGLETAVDLMGDGGRHVVAGDTTDLRVLALPDLREVARRPGEAVLLEVVRWGGQPVVFTGTGGRHAFLGLGLRPVAEFPRERSVSLIPNVDPAGDGSLLAVSVGPTHALLDRRAPAKLVPLRVSLAGTAPGAAAPRQGPVRLDGDARPDLLGIRALHHGNPAMGGMERGEYELRLLPAPGHGDGRVLRRAKVAGEGGGSAFAVDLDGDGRHEILIMESGNYMTCDMGGGGGTSRHLLLDGDGRLLWQDEPRHFSFDRGRGGRGRQHRDGRARVRVIDLAGDGTLALQVRTPTEEWYVVPARSSLRGAPPACIE